MNKLDRAGASLSSSLLSLLSHRLHPRPMLLTLPIASFDPEDYSRAEPGIQGLVDLVNWEVWKWSGKDKPSRYPLPTNVDALDRDAILPPTHPIRPHLVSARTSLLENLSMFSEDESCSTYRYALVYNVHIAEYFEEILSEQTPSHCHKLMAVSGGRKVSAFKAEPSLAIFSGRIERRLGDGFTCWCLAHPKKKHEACLPACGVKTIDELYVNTTEEWVKSIFRCDE